MLVFVRLGDVFVRLGDVFLLGMLVFVRLR